MDTSQLELFQRLGLALALGLLIGAERGWKARDAEEGSRVAGLRTFALIGLSGGVWALLAQLLGEVLLGIAFLGFTAVILLSRLRVGAEQKDYGATTVIAALLTFGLGALAARGEMALAAAGAVVTALLLSVKPIVHDWLTRISYDELLAALKLLVMSLVLLPVLPNQGYGPWQAINPYEFWLMVVLIAGISFVGYAAVRIGGARRGILIAALAGGLVSSTAVTISYAGLSRTNPERAKLLAGGIGLACTTMYPRAFLVAVAIEPRLWPLLLAPLAAATLVGYATSAWLLARSAVSQESQGFNLRNPLELENALKFGLLLALVMLLTRAMQEWLGEVGIYILAAISGLADVDAINLSLSRMAGDSLATEVAAVGLLLAVASNTLVKAAIAIASGTRSLRAPSLLIFGSSALAGLVAFLAT